jgi:RNA polymerase-binding transcription factor DksA
MSEPERPGVASPDTIPIPADLCLRIENLMLKKALKQKELQELEQHESELQRQLMAEYGVGQHCAIDLARQCIIPAGFKP